MEPPRQVVFCLLSMLFGAVGTLLVQRWIGGQQLLPSEYPAPPVPHFTADLPAEEFLFVETFDLP